MIEALKAWSLFSFSLGCWTALTVLASRRGEAGTRRILAAFVGLLLLPPLNAYVSLARGRIWAPLFALSVHLTWAYGPLLLACVRQALCLPLPRSPWHALPLLVVNAGALAQAAWIDSPWLLAAMVLQVLAYAAQALRELHAHRPRWQTLRRHHANTSHYWLLFLALGLAAASLFDLGVLAAIQLERMPPMALLWGAAMVLGLYVDLIALFAIFQPEVFMPSREAEPAPEQEAPAPAVRAVELSADVARDLQWQLDDLMQRAKPHLEEDMSLAKLAALLDLTAHQLSELLNVHMGSSFYEHLNAWRHREAVDLLTRADLELTVADIAYRAGFNNRNSFYKVFKDQTGMTPAQYRREQKQGAQALRA